MRLKVRRIQNMKHKNARLMQILVVMVVVGIGLFVAVSPAYGLNSFLNGREDP